MFLGLLESARALGLVRRWLVGGGWGGAWFGLALDGLLVGLERGEKWFVRLVRPSWWKSGPKTILEGEC